MSTHVAVNKILSVKCLLLVFPKPFRNQMLSVELIRKYNSIYNSNYNLLKIKFSLVFKVTVNSNQGGIRHNSSKKGA